MTTRYALTDLTGTLAGRRRVTTTHADGTIIEQVIDAGDSSRAGLPLWEVVTDAQRRELLRTTYSWEDGDYDMPRLQGTIERTEGQGVNLVRCTAFSYGPRHNQRTDVREYDFVRGTEECTRSLLRRTHTDYLDDPAYLERHIFNLPTAVSVHRGDTDARIALTEYRYDTYEQQPLADAPGVEMHSAAHNPYGSGFDPRTLRRGNLTQVTRYADAASRSGPVTELLRYDITGNLVARSGTCCVEETVRFSRGYQYAYPTESVLGSLPDPSGWTTRVTSSATYDFNTGLLLNMRDASGRETWRTYDPVSLRPTAIAYPTIPIGDNVPVRRFSYTEGAELVVDESLEHQVNRGQTDVAARTRTYFDGLGRPWRISVFGQGRWNHTDVRYEARGRVSQQSLPFDEGDSTPPWQTFEYDALGRLTRTIAPDGTEIQRIAYNETQRPERAQDRLGQTTRTLDAWGRERWTRADSLDRLAEVVEPDPNGNGSVFEPGHTSTRYYYNALGQVSEIEHGPQWHGYVYDSSAGGLVSQLSINGETLARALSYSPNGSLRELAVGLGATFLTESYEYDRNYNLLVGQRVSRETGPLLNLTYDYARDGRVTGQLASVVNNLDGAALQNRVYGYDGLGRLISSSHSGPAEREALFHRYDYDNYGNRTRSRAYRCARGFSCILGPSTELPADRRDGTDGLTYAPESSRITTPGFAYDAAGNLRRGQRPDGSWQNYQYDAAGRLALVTVEGGAVLERTHYGDSRQRAWIESRIPGSEAIRRTYYAWNGDQVLAELRADPASGGQMSWARNHVYLGDRLLASLSPEGTSFHHPDRLGTRLITGANGAVVSQQNPFSFGTEREAITPDSSVRRFTTYERSAATGLDYAVNRTYAPQQGRFLQPDPLGLASARLDDPQSLNLYAYVRDDPVNLIDPSGLLPLDCWTTGYTADGVAETCVVRGLSEHDSYLIDTFSRWEQEDRLDADGRVPGRGGGTGSRGTGSRGTGSRGTGGGGTESGGCTQQCDRACQLARAMFDPTTGPRPTTELDMLAIGMLAAPVAVVGGVQASLMAGAIGTSNAVIGLTVRAFQIPWLRVGWALVPGTNRLVGGDPRFGGTDNGARQTLQALGFSNREMAAFQLVGMTRAVVVSNPHLINSVTSGVNSVTSAISCNGSN